MSFEIVQSNTAQIALNQIGGAQGPAGPGGGGTTNASDITSGTLNDARLSTNVLRATAQTLTDPEKAQARSNVAAASVSQLLQEAAVGQMRPLENVVTVAESTNPRPTDIWGGYLWGIVINTGAVHRSTDMGVTWSTKIADFVTGTQGMLPTDDGEVVFHTTNAVYKTIGWTANPATCTYSSKATVTNTTHCAFLRWGFDGSSDGSKFIIVEYGVTPEFWDLSRKGFISVDGGDTFVQRWDSFTQHGEAENELTHIHGACYDEWRDRFWISEGHSNVAGLYFSDDDGVTWTEHTGDAPRNASPTTLTATKYGIVLGTDSGNGGVYLLPATTSQATANAEWIWNWRNEIAQEGVAGYAVRAHRDDETGLVFIGFLAVYAGIAAPIVCTDGLAASKVHTQADLLLNDEWTHVLSSGGKIAAAYTASGVRRVMRATCEYKRRSADISVLDTGNMLGGNSQNIKSIAIGATSKTGTGANCVAINGSTDTAAEKSFALGATVTGARTVGIGVGITTASADTVVIGDSAAAAGSLVVCIGADSSVQNANSTGVGYGVVIAAGHVQTTAVGSAITSGGALSTLVGYGTASKYWGTAIGHSANAGIGVAIGRDANANDAAEIGAVAIGRGAVAGSSSVALGTAANASSQGSVALGHAVTATATNQLQIGSVHIELGELGGDPAAPAADKARLFIKDNGSGKTQLCVRFATGPVQVLATEP